MSRLARALSTIRPSRARVLEELFTGNLTKSRTCLEILVPYLKNLSQEAIFGSNKLKKQHETMKLQNEEAILKKQTSLMNLTGQAVHT